MKYAVIVAGRARPDCSPAPCVREVVDEKGKQAALKWCRFFNRIMQKTECRAYCVSLPNGKGGTA